MKTKMKNKVKALKAVLQPKKKKKGKPVFLSSGYTLKNLACTDTTTKAYRTGKYYLDVGDSNSGKTYDALEALAQASIDPNFDNYDLILDEPEEGADMDFKTFYGPEMALRVQPPSRDKNGKPVYSHTIEQFYYHLELRRRSDRPCIYVLDSMDVLSSDDEEKKVNEQTAAYERKIGKKSGEQIKVKGSYGDGKAGKNSRNLRRFLRYLKESGSILFIICQTRDNIGFGAMFNPKTRAGGHALKFYCGIEFWFSVAGQIKKKVRGKDRQQGIKARIDIKKNRQTGRNVSIVMPIYWSFGIDEVGGNIQFLIEEGHWTGTPAHNPTRVTAPEFNFKGKIESLVQIIEKNNDEKKLRLIVKTIWNDIKNSLSIRRKPRH